MDAAFFVCASFLQQHSNAYDPGLSPYLFKPTNKPSRCQIRFKSRPEQCNGPGRHVFLFPSFNLLCLQTFGRRKRLQCQLNEWKKQPTQTNNLSISQINLTTTYSSNSLCCKQTSHTTSTLPPQQNPSQIKPEGNKHHKVFSFFRAAKNKKSIPEWWGL